jgi:hypothetical protein
VTGAGSGIGGGLANFLGPAILGTGILASGGGKVAAGISALGGLLATKGGGSIGGLINIAKNPLGSPKIGTLGLLGLATEGAGIGIAGHNTGGVLGALEGAGGGALTGASIGTLIAPGIGTAVGAVVGAVAGFIGGILGGGKTKAQKIQEAITRQAVNPNLIASQEFDRAVSGSFAQTSNTTFSEQPGGVFDSFAISGGARQAPVVIHYSPTVQAFDSRGVDAVLQQHGTRIAQAVSGQVRTSASGFGRAAREAVSPA